jgi:hypothetical protein
MKNKNGQQQQQQPRVTVGRRQRTLPQPTAAGERAAQVDRRERESKALREERAKTARLEAELAATKYQHHIEDVVLLNKQEMGLDTIAFVSLDNSVANALKHHVRAGKPLRAFPVYDVISAWKARHGRAVRRPDPSGSLDQQLPPPAQQGQRRPGQAAVPGDQRSHDEAMRASKEHGARLREQDRNDRESYEAALRRHGLTDPSVGSVPGDPRGYFG